ncbi:poly-beta-hydroxybutyrate-responsive repressor [Psychrobacillus sp. NPDC093180]|uniref:poly-beta-hydroxybutyrate-responsive repressor n=1 Tax=Psychrobacillus sp. NPDC093180 TaxID=3364489 RepID=UPI003804E2DE
MESKEETKKNKNTNIGAPKNFLIPIMLLHLRDWNTHGYELMEKISQFGMESVDQGNFYRLLRQLEKDALVTSEWDTTSGGPAKRIYSITDAGKQYLDLWAGSLSQYQKMLNQFFNIYNPFFNPLQSSSNKKEDEE